MHFSKCHQQMFPERGKLFILAICFIASRALTSGKERKLRSINDRSVVPNNRLNVIDREDREYDRSPVWHNRDELNPSFLQPKAIGRAAEGEDSSEQRDEEDKLFAVIMSKDYRGSKISEIERFNRIGERMIARANITEEAKRVVRQVKRQKPGVFWTLAKVAFETVNETKSAISQISAIVQENFKPEPTTVRGKTASRTTTTTTTTQSPDVSNDADSIEATTTEEPFRLTRNDLQSLIRRNVRGLVRLFNIEWRDAINESQSNIRSFHRDLGNQISPYLQDNPEVA